MASDPLASVRDQISREVDDIVARCERLSPLDLHSRFDAVRKIAALHGMAALEGLARHGAQLALLPGQRLAVRQCLGFVADAAGSRSTDDRATILAAVAIRLH